MAWRGSWKLWQLPRGPQSLGRPMTCFCESGGPMGGGCSRTLGQSMMDQSNPQFSRTTFYLSWSHTRITGVSIRSWSIQCTRLLDLLGSSRNLESSRVHSPTCYIDLHRHRHSLARRQVTVQDRSCQALESVLQLCTAVAVSWGLDLLPEDEAVVPLSHLSVIPTGKTIRTWSKDLTY